MHEAEVAKKEEEEEEGKEEEDGEAEYLIFFPYPHQ